MAIKLIRGTRGNIEDQWSSRRVWRTGEDKVNSPVGESRDGICKSFDLHGEDLCLGGGGGSLLGNLGPANNIERSVDHADHVIHSDHAAKLTGGVLVEVLGL